MQYFEQYWHSDHIWYHIHGFLSFLSITGAVNFSEHVGVKFGGSWVGPLSIGNPFMVATIRQRHFNQFVYDYVLPFPLFRNL